MCGNGLTRAPHAGGNAQLDNLIEDKKSKAKKGHNSEKKNAS